jgi:hypothetical protein
LYLHPNAQKYVYLKGDGYGNLNVSILLNCEATSTLVSPLSQLVFGFQELYSKYSVAVNSIRSLGSSGVKELIG